MHPLKEQEQSPTLARTMKRLAGMAKFFLKSAYGTKAKWLLIALLLMMVGLSGLNVVNSYVGRYFMSAIEGRNWTDFYRFAWFYAGVFGLQTVVSVLFRFFEERLGLQWRDWLTRRTVDRYTSRRVYLDLQMTGTISNPDQRIAEDIKSLTISTLSFSLMIINGTLAAVTFSGVLWSISPKLFVVAVLYAVAGSVITIYFGKPLVRLNYRQSDREAEFRSELIRVREHAEGIALSESEPLMRERLFSRIDALVRNFARMIAVNRNLSFFTIGYNYMIQLIPTLLVAPMFMSGEVEFGVIGQSAMAFATLLGAFSLVVTQFQSLSAYASVIARLAEFTEGVENAEVHQAASRIGCERTSDRFEFHDMTLFSPDRQQHPIINKLSVSFLPGRCVFVGGANDVARRALFHALAGLHEAGCGSMTQPPDEQVAFLPEQPYLPPSKLKHLLLVLSNGDAATATDEEVRSVLKDVGLGPVITRNNGFEDECNWEAILSFEERQLMSVARVILSKPAFVLMDRPDSALQPDAQKRVLRILNERGISSILFSRGSADPEVHDSFLELNYDGSWTWIDLKQKS